MKPKNNISMFEALKALSSEQRAAATNQTIQSMTVYEKA